MARTARDLITQAAKAAGVIDAIESLEAEESSHALIELNNILETWNLDSLFPYLTHQNEIIRAYTAWSIGMIHSSTGLKKLNSLYKVEKSKLVKSEIELFL